MLRIQTFRSGPVPTVHFDTDPDHILFIVCDKPIFYINIYKRYEYVHIYIEEIVIFVVQILRGSERLAVNIAN